MNFSAVSDKSLIGKALRLPLRTIPSDARVVILQGCLRGYKWIAGSSNHGCWLGSYEYEKRKKFERTVERGAVVFDVGANVGFYTLLASVLAGPEGKVFAFEPMPRNLRYLNLHLTLNGVTNATVVQVAVADSDGTVCFDLGPNHATGHLDDQGRLRVQAVTLDDMVFARGLPAPSVIKIDVEGAEALVLRGAARVVSVHHPVVFLACHSQILWSECSALLLSHGYKLQPLLGGSTKYEDEVLATWHR